MKRIWILSLFVVLMSVDSVYAQEIKADEIEAVNAVLGDLYHIGYCERVIDLPYQVCRDSEFKKDTLIQSCNLIPKEYRIYDRKAINRRELDVLNLVTHVDTVLKDLNIEEHKAYLLNKVKEDPKLEHLVKEVMPLKKKTFSAGILKQNKLLIFKSINKNRDDYEKKHIVDTILNPSIAFKAAEPFRVWYGINGDSFIIAHLSFSRVYIDKSQKLGLFDYTLRQGVGCGYKCYVFISSQGGKWTVKKELHISCIEYRYS